MRRLGTVGATGAARKLASAAALGGGGLSVLGAGLYGVLVAEAKIARRVIGNATDTAPDSTGWYGRGRPGPAIRIALLGDSSAAGYGVDRVEDTTGAHLASGVAAPVGLRGDTAGQVGAGRVLDPVHAVARRAGVTQQRDPDRGTRPAAAVPTRRVRGYVGRVADHPAGDLRLGDQDPVEPGAEHGESSAAQGRGRCQLACCSCCPHEFMLRSRRWLD